MIVVLMYNLPEEEAEDILKTDLHGDDMADEITGAALWYNDQIGAWHFSKTEPEDVEMEIDRLWYNSGETVSYYEK